MTYKKPSFIRPKLKKVARTWEIIIAMIIFVFLLYRVALAYEWIPVEYQPSTFLSREYAEIKKMLKSEMYEPGAAGKASKWALGVLTDIEAYIEKRRQADLLRAQMSDRCQENAIFRFFMEWGEKNTSDECLKQNMRLQAADQDIRGVSDKKRKKELRLQKKQQQELLKQRDLQQQQLQQQLQSTPLQPQSPQPDPEQSTQQQQ